MTQAVKPTKRSRDAQAQMSKRESGTTERSRLDFRLEAEARILLERAATLEGRSLSEFVRHAAVERARRAIAEYETLKLNDEARAEFLHALDNPPEPSARLRNAYARYLEQRRE